MITGCDVCEIKHKYECRNWRIPDVLLPMQMDLTANLLWYELSIAHPYIVNLEIAKLQERLTGKWEVWEYPY